MRPLTTCEGVDAVAAEFGVISLSVLPTFVKGNGAALEVLPSRALSPATSLVVWLVLDGGSESEPVVARYTAIVLVSFAVAPRPVGVGRRPQADLCQQLLRRDLRGCCPFTHIVDNLVAFLVGNPSAIEGSPSSFFSSTCSWRSSRDHFIVLLQLGFILLYPSRIGRIGLAFKSSCAVLEKQLLPSIEVDATDAVLVAKLRDWHLFHLVLPYTRGLLFWRQTLTC